MKFSVLLPTRNRLDLLRYAIETVRRQDYDDWEIVVSDNFSDDDVGGYVRSLREPRIHYHRTGRFVSVTENWNNALARCNGDYVVMLGDDDGLLKGYFSSARRLIEEHRRPDLVYSRALLYAYPGVLPGHPDGFLRHYGAAGFLASSSEPFLLDREKAREMVRQSMRFRLRFDYNMQFALVSRTLMETMKSKGPFFQSPYPDYYAMNAMMLVAERILVVPRPLVAIGISPKSFGGYYFNDREEDGVGFLKNLADHDIVRRVREVILPGTDMNTSWLLAMETLLVRYGGELDLSVGYGRYRLLQMLSSLGRSLQSDENWRIRLRSLLSPLKGREKLRYGAVLGPLLMLGLLLPRRHRKLVTQIARSAIGTYPLGTYRWWWNPPDIGGRFANMLEVFERFDVNVTRARPAGERARA